MNKNGDGAVSLAEAGTSFEEVGARQERPRK
jgi:hypothetical protein